MESPYQECTECWALVSNEMVRAHREWHEKMDEAFRGLNENDRGLLELVRLLESRVARLRHHLLEIEGKAP